MKKSLISALTTAFVVGAASTTFAAANPFEDVPADHWAYDAVAQLAADGVIEGYGDGTYRGDQEITRYEMAQMVARAMAKGANGADKALIDKLAAEFADELSNLGVRVSALEKKVDNMKWMGDVRYTYQTHNARRHSGVDPNDGDHANRTTYQWYEVRFNPQMTINKNWTAKARIKYRSVGNTLDGADSASNLNNLVVDRAWVQGKYGNVMIELGKVPLLSAYEGHTGGMVADIRVSGGVVTFGKQLKVKIGAGRTSEGGGPLPRAIRDDKGQSIQFIELGGNVNDKFNAGLGFYRIGKKSFYNSDDANRGIHRAYDDDGANYKSFGSDWRNIWKIGFNYKFAPQWSFGAAYARSNGDWESKFKQAYSIELAYNGGRYADTQKPGSFGAFVAYRYLGAGAIIADTYDAFGETSESSKGFEVGVSFVPFKNVIGTLLYFNGHDIGVRDDVKAQIGFGCLQFYF